MKFLLKLEHWQLFLIVFTPVFINFFSSYNSTLNTISMIFFTIGTLGWVWAISTSLNDKLPLDSKLNIKVFRILFLIPIIYILLLTLGLDYILNEGDGNGGLFGVIIILHLFSMFCIFYGLRFAAKTMKSVELGRNAKFGDYAGEFFLMWFSFIGYWVLQPRLNKLIK